MQYRINPNCCGFCYLQFPILNITVRCTLDKIITSATNILGALRLEH